MSKEGQSPGEKIHYLVDIMSDVAEILRMRCDYKMNWIRLHIKYILYVQSVRLRRFLWRCTDVIENKVGGGGNWSASVHSSRTFRACLLLGEDRRRSLVCPRSSMFHAKAHKAGRCALLAGRSCRTGLSKFPLASGKLTVKSNYPDWSAAVATTRTVNPACSPRI